MASTYITRTPSSTTNRRTFTLSYWIKFSDVNMASAQRWFSAGNDGTGNLLKQEFFSGTSTRAIAFIDNNNNGTGVRLTTKREFRDASGWYHIVYAVDTTQATASNRVKMYVNGEQNTDWYDSSTHAEYPNQNYDFNVNVSGQAMQFGRSYGFGGSSADYFDGYMSHIHFIDGTAYDASYFGETDSTTGEWKIKTSPSVTYGTNGFFILKDGNSVTDQSNNTNNFTVSGGTLTNTEDCPSNVFATLNPNDTGLPGTKLNLDNGNNTTMNTSGYGDYGVRSTLGANSGKYYWEAKHTTGNCTGIQPMDTKLIFDMFGSTPEAHVYGIQRYNDSSTNFFSNTTFTQQNTAAWGGITSGDIIGYALDLDNGKIFCSKNGNFRDLSGNVGDPANGTNPTFTISDTDRVYGAYVELRSNNDNGTQMNFGNGYFGTTAISTEGTNASGIGKFEYDVPTGYTALSTKGLNE